MCVVKVLHRFSWSLLNVFKRFFTKLNFSLRVTLKYLSQEAVVPEEFPLNPTRLDFSLPPPCMPLHLATP